MDYIENLPESLIPERQRKHLYFYTFRNRHKQMAERFERAVERVKNRNPQAVPPISETELLTQISKHDELHAQLLKVCQEYQTLTATSDAEKLFEIRDKKIWSQEKSPFEVARDSTAQEIIDCYAALDNSGDNLALEKHNHGFEHEMNCNGGNDGFYTINGYGEIVYNHELVSRLVTKVIREIGEISG